jgi:cytochrome c-type biogenesis protein CcmH
VTRSPRTIATALVLTLCTLSTLAAQTATRRDSVAREATVRQVASELRCPVCQGLSIQDSPSELAQSMRAIIREQLAAGKTPEEVKAHFVAGYGEWVLLEPRAHGFNLAVYILPILAALAGAIVIVVLARRWATRPAEAFEDRNAEDPDLAAWEEIVPKN